MKKSAVVDNETGRSKDSRVRTSSGTFLRRGQDDIISRIEERIAKFTFIPKEHGEGLQVLHYEVGQKYDAHHDYFHDSVNTRNGGQRIATVLMYLTDVEAGGETVFPNAKVNSHGRMNCHRLPRLGLQAAGECSLRREEAPRQAQRLHLGSGTRISLSFPQALRWCEKSGYLGLLYLDGAPIHIEQEAGAAFQSEARDLKLTRLDASNSLRIYIPGLVNTSVPIYKEESRVHGYEITADDCFAHLEANFQFLSLSDKVEGVLGQTYAPAWETPIKQEIAIQTLGILPSHAGL